MELIDTHAHVNFRRFNNDADEVILNSLNNNVNLIIVGSNLKTSRRALELANKYEKGVYAAVGLHPIHLEDIFDEDCLPNKVLREQAEDFNYEVFEKMAKLEKTVAIGEIGLDYYRLNLDNRAEEIKKKQRAVFWEELVLARNLNLPAIIHCRQAHEDLLPLLADFKEENKNQLPKDRSWGVIHCFSGDENLAWKYFNLGLAISFTGIITFSRQWDDLIRKMPLDRFMVETDCPFLAPEPYRGRRNEPIFVGLVAKRIAEIRGVSIEKIAAITTENARNFFGV